ncbi:MAG: lipid-A-disaccharide synthase [Burkholderiaceae bacterium]|nr:lipid-A-disaccharide synthase [Burkholderiaceae bacterium]
MTARVAMVAGEASGDLLAATVLPALARQGTPECAGIGGDRMIAAGFRAWWHVRELSVRGYAEVLRHLPRLLALRRALIARIRTWPAQVFVGVDAPDFNLGVAVRLRQQGIRTVQFVAPAIWAWRPQRLTLVQKGVDHLLTIFPFEHDAFAAAGVRTTYVGHPLAVTLPQRPDAAAARARLSLPAAAPTLAVLPGSRPAEVAQLLTPFLQTVAWLQRRDTALQAVIAAADALLAQQVEAARRRLDLDPARVHVVTGRSHDCLEAADAALVASGTATLETLLLGRPMVIAYRVSWLTEWITRRKALIGHIGLPNILAGERIVPEFVQGEVRAEALGPALAAQLQGGAAVARLRERFAAIRASLTRDTPGQVAEAIVDAAR